MKFIRTLIAILVLLGGTIWILSFLYEPGIKPNLKIDPQVIKDPLQTPTAAKPFEVKKDGYVYTISPVFNYELNAVVISRGDNSLNDPLNTHDICVMWGMNTRENIYTSLTSKNFSFVCIPRTKGSGDQLYKQLKYNQLSNNHILNNDKNIDKVLDSIRQGDQIHLKGYLVNYTFVSPNGEKGLRQTSISRSDMDEEGNYLYETIFLSEASIIRSNGSILNMIYPFAGKVTIYGLIVSIILFIFSSFMGRKVKPVGILPDTHQPIEKIQSELQKRGEQVPDDFL